LSFKGLPISFPPDVTSVEKPKIIHKSLSYKGKVFCALIMGKRPWYPLKRRLDGSGRQGGCDGREKNPCSYL
jgi:hypothetical protein